MKLDISKMHLRQSQIDLSGSGSLAGTSHTRNENMYDQKYGFAFFQDPRTERGHRGHGHGPRGGWFDGEPNPDQRGGQPSGQVFGFMLGDRGDGRGGRHRGRGGFEFGFGRGHGRGERPLEQGDLRWLVLDLIATQPRHGYEIIKAIEDEFGGHYTPSPGAVYPTLTYLDETGLIASESQGNKKLYRITEEGLAARESNAKTIEAMRARMGEARERFGGPPAPEMMRAMENLRAAIRVRLSKGELSPEAVASITTILDRAATEIERS
jgi:DNA-binding PadR family transcriptional regulator